jgi:uncharacterized membrane protein
MVTSTLSRIVALAAALTAALALFGSNQAPAAQAATAAPAADDNHCYILRPDVYWISVYAKCTLNEIVKG